MILKHKCICMFSLFSVGISYAAAPSAVHPRTSLPSPPFSTTSAEAPSDWMPATTREIPRTATGAPINIKQGHISARSEPTSNRGIPSTATATATAAAPVSARSETVAFHRVTGPLVAQPLSTPTKRPVSVPMQSFRIPVQFIPTPIRPAYVPAQPSHLPVRPTVQAKHVPTATQLIGVPIQISAPTSRVAHASDRDFPGLATAIAASREASRGYNGTGNPYKFPVEGPPFIIDGRPHLEYRVDTDGNQCGYFALGSNRHSSIGILLRELNNRTRIRPTIRQVLALEIARMLIVPVDEDRLMVGDLFDEETSEGAMDAGSVRGVRAWSRKDDYEGEYSYRATEAIESLLPLLSDLSVIKSYLLNYLGQSGRMITVEREHHGSMDIIAALLGYKLEIYTKASADSNTLVLYHKSRIDELGIGGGLETRKLILRGNHFNILKNP